MRYVNPDFELDKWFLTSPILPEHPEHRGERYHHDRDSDYQTAHRLLPSLSIFRLIPSNSLTS